MLASFLLFALIGFIPYVATYLGLGIDFQQTKRVIQTETILYLIGAAIVKFFAISVLLPEVQGHNIQTFVVTLVIHSLEFFFFRKTSIKIKGGKKVDKMEKGKVLAFWWAAVNAFAANILTFISNSRMQELDIAHIVHAISVLSLLFIYFSMQNISMSMPPNQKNIQPMKQVYILLLGLPAALSSIDTKNVVPAFVPHLLKLVSSALLWAATRGLRH